MRSNNQIIKRLNATRKMATAGVIPEPVPSQQQKIQHAEHRRAPSTCIRCGCGGVGTRSERLEDDLSLCGGLGTLRRAHSDGFIVVDDDDSPTRSPGLLWPERIMSGGAGGGCHGRVLRDGAHEHDPICEELRRLDFLTGAADGRIRPGATCADCIGRILSAADADVLRLEAETRAYLRFCEERASAGSNVDGSDVRVRAAQLKIDAETDALNDLEAVMAEYPAAEYAAAATTDTVAHHALASLRTDCDSHSACTGNLLRRIRAEEDAAAILDRSAVLPAVHVVSVPSDPSAKPTADGMRLAHRPSSSLSRLELGAGWCAAARAASCVARVASYPGRGVAVVAVGRRAVVVDGAWPTGQGEERRAYRLGDGAGGRRADPQGTCRAIAIFADYAIGLREHVAGRLCAREVRGVRAPPVREAEEYNPRMLRPAQDAEWHLVIRDVAANLAWLLEATEPSVAP
mmetsp:Transcript_23300/g.36156  ORF Transcript_23300/g.36156 Transcript_23300/m.36156 type:complete len:460 (+) Transcript_23300:37-1416(+)